MDKNPLVSILIPLFNAEKYLVECLESILNQTYKNIEIIIVNDASTDNSLLIVKEYAANNEHINVYSQTKSGASSARNHAFTYAKGDYIQYFDADDIMDSNKILFQIEALKKHGFNENISSISKWARFHLDIDNAIFEKLKTYKSYDNTLLYLNECWGSSQCMIGPSWLIHRKLNEKIGGWDSSLSLNDDALFNAKVAYFSDKIIYVDKSILYWRQDNMQSLSKVTTFTGIKSHLSVCNKLTKLIESDTNFDSMKYSLAMEYSKCLFKAYPKYMSVVKEAEHAIKKLGFDRPLPLATKKFRFFSKLIGFYPTVRLFNIKNYLTTRILLFKASRL